MKTRSDLEGKKFQRLTVIKFDGHRGVKRMWLCRCDCGELTRVETGYLKRTISCGCYARKRASEATSERNRTHGMTGTKVYSVWFDMKRRCQNKNNKRYDCYGSRGIKVCRRWNKFENFFKDMGYPPKGKTLDRINNDGDYSPENCRWADKFQQANNRRNNRILIVKGERLTMKQASKKYDVNYHVLRDRLNKHGWEDERAVGL